MATDRAEPSRLLAAEPARAEKIGVWLPAVGQTIGYAGLYDIFASLLLAWDRSVDWGKEALIFAFMGAIIDQGRGRWLLGGGMAFGAAALGAMGAAESYVVFTLCWLLGRRAGRQPL